MPETKMWYSKKQNLLLNGQSECMAAIINKTRKRK